MATKEAETCNSNSLSEMEHLSQEVANADNIADRLIGLTDVISVGIGKDVESLNAKLLERVESSVSEITRICDKNSTLS